MPRPDDPQSFNRYAYARHNPLKYTDPSGHIVETVWDIISIGLSIEEVARNPGDPLNWVGLAVDVGATLLPGVPGGVGAVRKATKLASEVASHADEAAQSAAKAANQTERVGQQAAKQAFKGFTEQNFRDNLMRLTGKSADDVKGFQAHHVLPQKFASDFKKAGIENIHDPKFGSWVKTEPHQQWSYRYNTAWEEFFDKNKAKQLTPKDVLNHARKLAKEFDFDVHFDNP